MHLRNRALPLATICVLAVVLVAGVVIVQHRASSNSTPGSGIASASITDGNGTLQAGTPLKGNAAPPMHLVDQQGNTIALDQFAGHPMVLTFMDAVCTQVCPITAEYLNMTAQFLGPQASQVNWVAISVNPSNTPAQVDAFLTKNKVTIPLHFLLGTQTQLAPLWSAYHQEVILSQQTGSQDTGHTANTYVLDAHGHEQEVLDQTYDPKALAADLRVLLQQP